MPDTDDLTPTENAILVVLMAEARDIPNKELEERFGFTLTGKSREKLNRLQLVESWKEGRSFSHRLGEAGWARCASPLNFDGARPRAFGAALGSLLAAVHRDLLRTHRSLAMAFAPDAAGGVAGAPAPTSASLQDRIREAYHALASGPGGWVSIADIRRKLGDARPDELDAALRDLERAPDINIVPQSNQKALSPEDEQAAIIIGGQRKHYLAIGV
jgi:hypothetical protein